MGGVLLAQATAHILADTGYQALFPARRQGAGADQAGAPGVAALMGRHQVQGRLDRPRQALAIVHPVDQG
ncbi:hypothetical protein D3C80_2206890 [compost metagenome]